MDLKVGNIIKTWSSYGTVLKVGKDPDNDGKHVCQVKADRKDECGWYEVEHVTIVDSKTYFLVKLREVYK